MPFCAITNTARFSRELARKSEWQYIADVDASNLEARKLPAWPTVHARFASINLVNILPESGHRNEIIFDAAKRTELTCYLNPEPP
jgi:hypothetical protein